MVRILHLSDLHFCGDAQAINMRNNILKAAKDVRDLSRNEKLLIITGDFHNFGAKDYADAQEFIDKLVKAMDIDREQDIFIIPGNHDVGNDKALDATIGTTNPKWKKENIGAVASIKGGDFTLIDERLQMFTPYCQFAHAIGVYSADEANALLPAKVHVRTWRGKLNILHLNTALVADGFAKDNQMADVGAVVSDGVRDALMRDGLPVLVLGHNNFFDLNEDQQKDLQAAFGNLEYPNVSAYLCGDTHRITPNDLKKRILLHPNNTEDTGIANIICVKGISERPDYYSDFGFFWHEWNEKTDAVLAHLKSWDRDSCSDYYDNGKGYIQYKMRRSVEKSAVLSSSDGHESGSTPNSVLIKYLKDLLRRAWINHPSYKLMNKDGVDERLYPGVKDPAQFQVLGKMNTADNAAKCPLPVWQIIQDSWTKGKKRNIVIEGEGGIGKTVTLFAKVDSEDMPPAVYVPMHRLVDEKGECIKISNYLKGLSEQYGEAILALANSGWDTQTGPKLLILLDGFNEVPHVKRRTILNLINDWNDGSGAQLIAVSRTMNGIDLAKSLMDNPIAITLEPLDKENAKKYLQDYQKVNLNIKIQIPPDDSPLWSVLRLPLFLNLYRKTSILNGIENNGYKLDPKPAESGGALIWNYLQRELLRIKDETWVLGCAFACEYILPYIAFKMVQDHRFTIKRKAALARISEALDSIDFEHLPRHLTSIVERYKSEKFSQPDLSNFAWGFIVLKDVGLLIEDKDNYYTFIHQNFRDALAGMWLVNKAEMIRNKNDVYPEEWKRAENHYVMDYAAELMNEEEAKNLWEANRKARNTDRSATYAMLELQKRRKDKNALNLDFSGMDLTEMSLTRYMRQEEQVKGGGWRIGRQGDVDMKLFRKADLSKDTKFSEDTFSSPGHTKEVKCVAVTEDGLCVSGSKDNTLRVWDLRTGECRHTLEGHTEYINCVAVTKKGKCISGAGDTTLRVWDIHTGEFLRKLEGHTKSVTCVAVIGDELCVSGSNDETLRVWDLNTGECLRIMPGENGCFNCIAVTRDGKLCVSGSENGHLQVWDLQTGKSLRAWLGHTFSINCVAVYGNECCVSGSDDTTLRVWNLLTGECLHILEGHKDWVKSVAVTEDGKCISGAEKNSRVSKSATNQFVNAEEDKALLMWDLNTGKYLGSLDGQKEGHKGAVYCVAVTSDGLCVTGSSDRTLRVWDWRTNKCIHTLEGQTVWIRTIAMAGPMKCVVGSTDGYLRVWDLLTMKCCHIWKAHRGEMNSVAIVRDGKTDYCVCGTNEKHIGVWDLEEGKSLRTLEGLTHAVNCVAITEDGLCVAGSSDNTLRVWDLHTGESLRTLTGHTNWVRCIAVAKNGLCVSGSSDKTLRVWNIHTGESHVLGQHEDAVRCVAVTEDGLCVSGSTDNTLRVWDIQSGKMKRYLKRHKEWVRCVAVTKDGRCVSGSTDGTLKVWNIHSGKCLYTLKGHTGWVRCVVVTDDGRCISGATDGTIRVWDINTGKYLFALYSMEVDVHEMEFYDKLIGHPLIDMLSQNGAKIIQHR